MKEMDCEVNSFFEVKCELNYQKSDMAYQYVREPLRSEETDLLCHSCGTVKEKLIIWTLIDTGLRVSELCSLTPQNILWQQKSIRISGKGGPYGKKSKKRVVPMSRRVQALLEPYFSLPTHCGFLLGKM